MELGLRLGVRQRVLARVGVWWVTVSASSKRKLTGSRTDKAPGLVAGVEPFDRDDGAAAHQAEKKLYSAVMWRLERMLPFPALHALPADAPVDLVGDEMRGVVGTLHHRPAKRRHDLHEESVSQPRRRRSSRAFV